MPTRPPALPAEVLERHRVFNRNSAGRWEAFSQHRRRVNDLLGEVLRAGSPQARLCVIGAGNCNDLELPALAARTGALHLVDIDEEALQRGVERQGLAASETLVLHAPLDVTGIVPRLKSFAQQKPASAAVDDDEQRARTATSAATTALAALPGPFEVVVSACLLSQLMHTCRLSLGARHPALVDVAHALVLAHLRALTQLTAPGGRLVLLTDTASTETYPLVELWDAQPPRTLLEQLEQTDNVLSGTGSIYLRRLLAGDPVLRPGLTRSRLVDPWLWQLGDDVTLLAYALVATRAG